MPPRHCVTSYFHSPKFLNFATPTFRGICSKLHFPLVGERKSDMKNLEEEDGREEVEMTPGCNSCVSAVGNNEQSRQDKSDVAMEGSTQNDSVSVSLRFENMIVSPPTQIKDKRKRRRPGARDLDILTQTDKSKKARGSPSLRKRRDCEIFKEDLTSKEPANMMESPRVNNPVSNSRVKLKRGIKDLVLHENCSIDFSDQSPEKQLICIKFKSDEQINFFYVYGFAVTPEMYAQDSYFVTDGERVFAIFLHPNKRITDENRVVFADDAWAILKITDFFLMEPMHPSLPSPTKLRTRQTRQTQDLYSLLRGCVVLPRFQSFVFSCCKGDQATILYRFKDQWKKVIIDKKKKKSSYFVVVMEDGSKTTIRILESKYLNASDLSTKLKSQHGAGDDMGRWFAVFNLSSVLQNPSFFDYNVRRESQSLSRLEEPDDSDISGAAFASECDVEFQSPPGSAQGRRRVNRKHHGHDKKIAKIQEEITPTPDEGLYEIFEFDEETNATEVSESRKDWMEFDESPIENCKPDFALVPCMSDFPTERPQSPCQQDANVLIESQEIGPAVNDQESVKINHEGEHSFKEDHQSPLKDDHPNVLEVDRVGILDDETYTISGRDYPSVSQNDDAILLERAEAVQEQDGEASSENKTQAVCENNHGNVLRNQEETVNVLRNQDETVLGSNENARMLQDQNSVIEEHQDAVKEDIEDIGFERTSATVYVKTQEVVIEKMQETISEETADNVSEQMQQGISGKPETVTDMTQTISLEKTQESISVNAQETVSRNKTQTVLAKSLETASERAEEKQESGLKKIQECVSQNIEDNVQIENNNRHDEKVKRFCKPECVSANNEEKETRNNDEIVFEMPLETITYQNEETIRPNNDVMDNKNDCDKKQEEENRCDDKSMELLEDEVPANTCALACDAALDEEPAHKKMSIRDELMIYPVDKRFLNEVEKQFDLTRLVGSGTFGEVYEAYDRLNHRKVAIKRLFPYQTLDAHKKEAGFISSLNGKPNIVQIQHSPPLAPDGIILVEEQQALIFEFFEHDNPSDYVKDSTIKEISHYMKNLFVALRSVHSLGIIHRDVKLNNFLYDRKNKKYLLVDFGLAEKKIPKSTMGASRPKEQIQPSGRRATSDTASKSGHPTKSNGYILTSDVSTASSRTSRPQKEKERIEMAQQMAKRRMMSGRKPKDAETVSSSRVKLELPANRGGTRGYRAPEVLMGSQHQTTAVDVWSAGVILLNLLCRKTHFQWFRHDNDNLATMEIYW